MSSSSFPDHHCYGPSPDQSLLNLWLVESNQRTRSILINLKPGQEIVQKLDTVNPPFWEFGHLTWFHEFWVHRKGDRASPTALLNSDAWFNSSDISHSERWEIAIPDIQVLLEFNSQVIDRTLRSLEEPLDSASLYFIQLAIFHQDMHNEAFAYMWQTLGYSEPFESFVKSIQNGNENVNVNENENKKNTASTLNKVKQTNTYIQFPESIIEAGSKKNTGFIFDNEKWVHPVTLPAFSISKQAVSNGQYLDFIESTHNQSSAIPLTVPKHWKKEDGVWSQRFFDQWLALNTEEPVRHIAHSDAQKYCQGLGVRMPNEHELTLLMSQPSDEWEASHLWEWSSSAFLPFPGFKPDPYVDYSKPWFDGNYQVLKGWSVYTPERLRWTSLRNFYAPTRSDHFCGFRTCLL